MEHSKDLSVEAMMLDSRAFDFDKEERPDVCFARDLLISLPLEERLIKWLSEGRQVNRFAALLHLDPTISIKDDLLRILPLYAYLVQGLWISKSSLICKGFEALVRDYIIFLFSKNKTIRYDKRKSLMPYVVKRYLSQLAFQRPLFSDLKFKEATDLSFIKAYPHAVKEQECAWSSREHELLESLRGPFRNMQEKQAVDFLMNALNPKLVKKVTSSGIADPGHKKDMNMMASSTGEDQKQHLELTRELAERVNHLLDEASGINWEGPRSPYSTYRSSCNAPYIWSFKDVQISLRSISLTQKMFFKLQMLVWDSQPTLVLVVTRSTGQTLLTA